MSRPDIIEGIDYYREPGGRLVFTESYHLKRGYCCNGRCRHCPYKNKLETNDIKPVIIINADGYSEGEKDEKESDY